MTNDEAIKILGYYDVSDIHFYDTDGEEIPFTDWSDAIEMAISALRKQIPKQTIKPESPYFRYACPSCGNYPLSGHYCGECGQAIDWEGEG